MKKSMLIAFVTIFILSVFAASCLAEPRTMANTSKKGSLVILPLIKVGPSIYQDTIVSISNDYYRPVHLQCIYKIPEDCDCVEFDFTLTPNQEISFSAKTGLGVDGEPIPTPIPIGISIPAFNPALYGNVAELKCWAAEDNATVANPHHPISFNWLSAWAIVSEGLDMAWQYNAWRFAVGKDVPNEGRVGENGILKLTGTPLTYDACPSRLMFNFIEQTRVAAGAFPDDNGTDNPRGGAFQTVNNLLTLIPCKQDCVSDNNTIVRASLAVNNEVEASRSTYTCLGCANPAQAFFDKPLSTYPQIFDISPFVDSKTPGGMFRVSTKLNNNAADCNATIGTPATSGVPLLGVMAIQFSSSTGPIAGETPTALGPGQGLVTDLSGQNTTTEVAITYTPY